MANEADDLVPAMSSSGPIVLQNSVLLCEWVGL
jgi:hypothetical protein